MVVQYYSKIVSVTKFLSEGTFWRSLHFGQLFQIWNINAVATELTLEHIMEKLCFAHTLHEGVNPSSNANRLSPSE